jgi:hypothetical protein
MKKLIALTLATVLTLSANCVYAADNQTNGCVFYNTESTRPLNTSYGGYATYPNSNYLPDFTAVTGIQGQRVYLAMDQNPAPYSYAYTGVDKQSMLNYIKVLENSGYVIYDSTDEDTPYGKYVHISAYLPGAYPNEARSAFVISYFLAFPTVLIMMVRD